MNRHIRLDSSYVLAWRMKGLTLHALKRYEEALTAYKQAISLDPTDVQAYIGKGDILYDLKRYEEALLIYEQAIHLEPTSAEAYNGKAILTGRSSVENRKPSPPMSKSFVLMTMNLSTPSWPISTVQPSWLTSLATRRHSLPLKESFASSPGLAPGMLSTTCLRAGFFRGLLVMRRLSPLIKKPVTLNPIMQVIRQ